MRRVSFVVPLLFALLLGLLTSGLAPGAQAQDATPAGEATFPFTPDPADCQVEPRSADELVALWFENGTPIPLATPQSEAQLTEVTVPVGPAADAETVAAVTEAVRQILGCFAAGDFPRALALFTDDLARQFGPEPGTTEEEVRAFVEATPEPGAEGEVGEVLAITDVMELADGRVGAFIVSDEAGTLTTVYVIFKREDNRLLADEVIEFSMGGDTGE
jgi:hypothetical protein